MQKTGLRKLCLPLVLALAAQAPMPVAAASGNSSLSVGSTVISACLVIGSAIAFGTYATSQIDQTGAITILCTFGTSYNVGLDAGSGTGATTTVRKLTGLTGGTLNYALYRDASRTSPWGTTVGTNTQASTGTGLLQSMTVYGRIPAGQQPQADIYTDTVTVTLTY